MIQPEIFRWKLKSEIRNGRNISEGYARGWGLQFDDLREKISKDPLYQEASALANGRTIVTEDNRMNIFLIMKYFLPKISTGHIVEFGSYKGGNAIFMSAVARALLPNTKVYAFDTFNGMPATDNSIDAHSVGDFNDVDLEELRLFCLKNNINNIEFVKGLFEETTSSRLSFIKNVALAHIDCDIKSACEYSYNAVSQYMVRGGYIIFDDAIVSSCLGATEVVENLVIRRDGLNCEQIFPHFVFRHGLLDL